MLKKVFKVLTVLALLAACHIGYVCGFAIVVDLLRASRRTEVELFVDHPSNSKKQSIANAQAAFGQNHWSMAEDLGYRYYNTERGFWMYARDYEPIVEENGVHYNRKRVKLRPFALIIKSRDGKNTKTITADLAIFDLNEPLSFNSNPNGEQLKVNHARLEQNVLVRDDKNTPAVPADDMTVGPLTVAEYDDLTRQIHTESYVVIQDPDMVTTGWGMVIQLRKDETPRLPGSSSGFEGAERMDLLRNVHVVVRDVGNSGLLPAAPAATRAAKGKAAVEATVVTGSDGQSTQTAEPKPPTPLDIRCDAKMQVNLPKPVAPVAIGPPAPPGPTAVQFERNVVVLRGQLDDQPDQMTCDTLKLYLVPGDKSTETGGAPSNTAEIGSVASSGDSAQASSTTQAQQQPKAQTSDRKPAINKVAQTLTPSETAKHDSAGTEAAESENNGLFGGLTLQRAYATGHVVWLHLPQQGIKLRCNELFHIRQVRPQPDKTYFRGDATRPVEIEKVDIAYDENDELDPGTVTGVTNIWTIDATLLDNGTGTDSADVVAHGPGRLETRPDRNQPIERIAIWQEKFILHNELGPDGQVLHKIIDLTGNRPCFIDKAKDTRLDSAQLIKVTLKPKTPSSNAGTSEPKSSDDDTGGSGFQIERLVAVQDVHLIAPAKTMNAKYQLYAEFFEIEPASRAPAPTAARPNGSEPPNGNPDMAEPPDVNAVTEPILAQEETAKKPTDPSMTGAAERIWARIGLKPKPVVDERPDPLAKNADPALVAEAKPASATRSKISRKKTGSSDTDAEIRMAWLWGNVSLHQEPAEGKTKGQDARGEALYLDNRGPNKAITYVYQRDPTEVTYLPGPLPPALVENETMQMTAAGILRVNQETDQAWTDGPGTMTQITDRGFFTDKSPDETEDGELPTDPADANDRLTAKAPSPTTSTGTTIKTRSTAMVTADSGRVNSGSSLTGPDQKVAKPKLRAGRPVTEKVPLVIGFTDGMDFTGRTVDPEGRPAAQARFYGMVNAEMEDAKLHGEEKMIAYTDKVVPLAQLGEMSKAQSKPKADNKASADGDAESEPEPEPDPQIALIFTYHNAVAISRKVDPDSPQVLQQQRIEADDILAYDRRSGDFFVPGKGIVYLYDRSNDSTKAPGAQPEGEVVDKDGLQDEPAQRTLTPTSSRSPARADPRTKAQRADGRRQTKLAEDPPAGKQLPPLVLTQIHFVSGMLGQFGTSKENGKTETRWADFFNNVETLRAKVPDTYTKLNRDKLPRDGFFLTGQTLQVITEPPPVGAPASAPARNYLKAWENAYVFSGDKVVQADVITYDSYKDLIYAYGENGRGVIYAEQHAAGQPTSPGSAKAAEIHPNTGAMHLINSDTVRMLDKNTGIRPSPAMAPDPFAKPKKKVKQPYRLPQSNMERRGFTGQ